MVQTSILGPKQTSKIEVNTKTISVKCKISTGVFSSHQIRTSVFGFENFPPENHNCFDNFENRVKVKIWNS